MSRDIKFRVFNRKTGKMNPLYAFIQGKENGTSNDIIDSFYEDHEHLWKLDVPLEKKFEIMQYVGIKDKNGVKVFEDDILGKDGEPFGVVEDIREVFQTNSTAYDCHAYASMDKGSMEILGNIHQNKDLLRKLNEQRM